MGRRPCCDKVGLNRGAWTAVEDKILKEYIKVHGEGRWRNLPKRAGLKRCGKSCRLRWLNYLRPDIKRGNITPDEEELIIRLHKLLGNRWSLIAGRLPGRTDNEIKNYWNTILGKKVKRKEEKNTRSPSSSDSKKWNTSNNVIRTKATKCSRLYFDPHFQPYQMDVASGPANDVVVGELSLPTNYENPGLMFEANQDLEMAFGAGTQEACNFSEFRIFFHVNNGDKKVNDGLLPSPSSLIQQGPLMSDELALVEDWNVQSLPLPSVLGDWLDDLS